MLLNMAKCASSSKMIGHTAMGFDDYMFHTVSCYNPFIVFDIGDYISAEKILVHNRTLHEGAKERAIDLIIESSIDQNHWNELAVRATEDLSKFETNPSHSFRFLRFSLDGLWRILHLKNIELIGVEKDASIKKFANRNTEFGIFYDNTFYPTHDFGFFSILSTMLLEISNNVGIFSRIDTSHCFTHFKDDPLQNIWPELFQENNTPLQSDASTSLLAKKLFHHDPYSSIDFDAANPLMAHYFSLSHSVQELVELLTEKYKIDYENLIGVCYRGTDKFREISPVDMDVYLSQAEELLNRNVKSKILIQTDQLQVRNAFIEKFKDRCFFLDEMPVTETQTVMHEIIQNEKLHFAKKLLAAVVILSRANHLVLSTCNVSYWICLFRKSAANTIQL